MKEIQFFNKKKYWLNGKYFKGRGKYMHRDVWEHYNGPIPSDCHIHHRDGDTNNNAIENLECLPVCDHANQHKEDRRIRLTETEEGKETVKKWREAGNDWNRSKEGRQFNRRRMIEIKKKQPLLGKVCAYCSKPFMAKNSFAKFCSNNCYQGDRRQRKVDFTEKKCVICFNTYLAKTHQKSLTCSQTCRGKLRSANAKRNKA